MAGRGPTTGGLDRSTPAASFAAAFARRDGRQPVAPHNGRWPGKPEASAYDEAWRRYLRGESTRTQAERLGVSRDSIYTHFHRRAWDWLEAQGYDADDDVCRLPLLPRFRRQFAARVLAGDESINVARQEAAH